MINASSVIDQEVLRRLELEDQPEMIRTGGSWSAIVSPTGTMLAGPAMEEETLLVADIDLSEIVFLKYACDSAGHYARPDILRLATNLEPQPTAAPFAKIFGEQGGFRPEGPRDDGNEQTASVKLDNDSA